MFCNTDLVRKRLIALALAAALTTLALSGCSGDDKPKAEDKTLAPRLANAKAALDGAETIDVDLSTESIPDGVTGLLSAKGTGNHSPAFKGTVKVVVGGSTIDADITAVDDEVFAKIGFLPLAPIDPADYEAPDPASLIDSTGGISDLLISSKSLVDGGQSRDGETVLSAIKGKLSGKVVKTLVPSADATKSFTVAYRLTDDDELRDVSINGPFYPDSGDITYSVKVATSDTPVTITKP